MSDYRQPPLINDQRQLREELGRSNRRQRALEQDDIVVEHPRRIVLRSPNGHYWAISIHDDGTLAASDVGTKPR
jgi:hypothetical protein